MQHKTQMRPCQGGFLGHFLDFQMSCVGVFSMLHFAVGNSFDSTPLCPLGLLNQYEGLVTFEVQKNQHVQRHPSLSLILKFNVTVGILERMVVLYKIAIISLKCCFSLYREWKSSWSPL